MASFWACPPPPMRENGLARGLNRSAFSLPLFHRMAEGRRFHGQNIVDRDLLTGLENQQPSRRGSPPCPRPGSAQLQDADVGDPAGGEVIPADSQAEDGSAA